MHYIVKENIKGVRFFINYTDSNYELLNTSMKNIDVFDHILYKHYSNIHYIPTIFNAKNMLLKCIITDEFETYLIECKYNNKYNNATAFLRHIANNVMIQVPRIVYEGTNESHALSFKNDHPIYTPKKIISTPKSSRSPILNDQNQLVICDIIQFVSMNIERYFSTVVHDSTRILMYINHLFSEYIKVYKHDLSSIDVNSLNYAEISLDISNIINGNIRLSKLYKLFILLFGKHMNIKGMFINDESKELFTKIKKIMNYVTIS